MRDSKFAREFKRLITERVQELVSDTEALATSAESVVYKRHKMDSNLDMIQHNFNIYWNYFKTPHNSQEEIMQSLNMLYKIQ